MGSEAPWVDVEAAAPVYVFDVQKRPDRPRRVAVLVFLDTVRADRMSVYGHRRDTTPFLARWADEVAVFDRAYAPAPWTLPSARAMLGGARPERWREHGPLALQAAAGGMATRAFFTNVNTSASTGLPQDFAAYRYEVKADAAVVVEQTLAWIGEDQGDLLAVVQFMDAHQPYRVPEPYSEMWLPAERADLAPSEWPSVAADDPRFPVLRAEVEARYDQALRHIDAELERLIGSLPDDAVVVVASDHGEELWEHDAIGHGHDFWEEVLHVPLLVRAPNVPPGRYQAPVTLIDIVPTMLDALGMDVAAYPGTMLGTSPPDRVVSFGRRLYGTDGWGWVGTPMKWWAADGEELAFDVVADPRERDRLLFEGASQFDAGEGVALEPGWLLEVEADVATARTLVLTGRHLGSARLVGQVRAPHLRARQTGAVVEVRVEAGTEAPDLFVPLAFDGRVSLAVDGLQVHGSLTQPPASEDSRVRVLRTWQPRQAAPPTTLPHDRLEELRTLGYLD
jgi:hypothetical protein